MDNKKEILMFGTGQRFVHWLHTAAFATLIVTGAMIYVAPFGNSIARGDGGHLIRLTHRVGAIAFMLVPICYFVFDPRGLFGSLKRIFSWSKDDWEPRLKQAIFWASVSDPKLFGMPKVRLWGKKSRQTVRDQLGMEKGENFRVMVDE